MMMYSMTAFSTVQVAVPDGQLVCEMRSINHRYLDLSVYVPDFLRSFEMPIRDKIRTVIKRGKVECGIRFQTKYREHSAAFVLNEGLVLELKTITEQIASILNTAAPLNVAEVLRFPGVLDTKEVDKTTLEAAVLQVIDRALQDLAMTRGREGEDLKRLFYDRLDAMKKLLANVRERYPMVMQEARARLMNRFDEAKIALHTERLEQEMVMYAQKIDASEELDRLEMHIHEVHRIITQGGTVGRRLDFLMQELNREANTLGSKSTDAVITHVAVELKVLIEQLREQVQNIE